MREFDKQFATVILRRSISAKQMPPGSQHKGVITNIIGVKDFAKFGNFVDLAKKEEKKEKPKRKGKKKRYAALHIKKKYKDWN